jgi:hypothetical protein
MSAEIRVIHRFCVLSDSYMASAVKTQSWNNLRINLNMTTKTIQSPPILHELNWKCPYTKLGNFDILTVASIEKSDLYEMDLLVTSLWVILITWYNWYTCWEYIFSHALWIKAYHKNSKVLTLPYQKPVYSLSVCLPINPSSNIESKSWKVLLQFKTSFYKSHMLEMTWYSCCKCKSA